MTWIPTAETANYEAPPGVGPWRTLTDDEFAAIEAAYDAQFSDDQRGSLRRWFDHVDDAPPPATKKKAAPAAGGGE